MIWYACVASGGLFGDVCVCNLFPTASRPFPPYIILYLYVFLGSLGALFDSETHRHIYRDFEKGLRAFKLKSLGGKCG